MKRHGYGIRFVGITTEYGARVVAEYKTSPITPQFIAILRDGADTHVKTVDHLVGARSQQVLERWVVNFFETNKPALYEPSPLPKPQAPRPYKPSFRLASFQPAELRFDEEEPTKTISERSPVPRIAPEPKPKEEPKPTAAFTEESGDTSVIERVETVAELPETVEELIAEQASGVVAGWIDRRVPRLPSAPSAPSPTVPAPSGPTCNGGNDAQTGLIGNAIADRIEKALLERLTIAEADIRQRVEAEIAAVGEKIDGKINGLWATVGEKIEAVFDDVATRCVWFAAGAVFGGFLWGRFGRRLKVSWASDENKSEI